MPKQISRVEIEVTVRLIGLHDKFLGSATAIQRETVGVWSHNNEHHAARSILKGMDDVRGRIGVAALASVQESE